MTDFLLSDFVELQRGNTYKSALLGKPGPKLLGLGSIQRNGGFKGENLKTYGGSSDPKILLFPGDIYVSLKDVTQSAELLGAIAKVPQEVGQGRLTQDTVKLIFKDSAPTGLVYWALRSPQYRDYCRAHATGTTNLGLSREDFLAYPIPYETPARRHLVATLDSIDDKISLNHRMNVTLQAMAGAIFKDWFVDFGPTRAKMEGCAPYLSPNIWSLFPERLDADKKPEGWKRLTLRDSAEVLSGGTPSKGIPEFWNGSIPWVSPKAMSEIHVSDSEDRVTPSAIGNGARMAASGSVLIMVRGMGLHQGVRISQARRDVAFNQDVKALVPKKLSGTHLLFGLLNVESYLFSKVETSGHGTGKLSTDVIDGINFVAPVGAVYQKLSEFLESLNNLIDANNSETTTLVNLRNLLLPKIVSGDIHIREAEKSVGEVA